MTFYEYIVENNKKFYIENGYKMPEFSWEYKEENGTWWKQQIARSYRVISKNGLSFYDSLDGLPKLNDIVK